MANVLGQGWAFPPHLDERSRIELVEGDDDIRQSLFIILNTAPGERVMRPAFGCRIHELLFWPANNHTAAIAERFVTEAIVRWEQRIDLKQVRVIPGVFEADDQFGNMTYLGALQINIIYLPKDQQIVHSLNYPFYLTPSS